MISVSTTILLMFPSVETIQLMVKFKWCQPASISCIILCLRFYIVDNQYSYYYMSVYISHPQKHMLSNPKDFSLFKAVIIFSIHSLTSWSISTTPSYNHFLQLIFRLARVLACIRLHLLHSKPSNQWFELSFPLLHEQFITHSPYLAGAC